MGGNVCVSYGVKGPPFLGGRMPHRLLPQTRNRLSGEEAQPGGKRGEQAEVEEATQDSEAWGGVQSSSCLQVETPPPSLLLSGLPFTPSMPRLLSLPPILL